MPIPLLFNFGDKVARTGASFHAPCANCRSVTKMFEAKRKLNVSLFWKLSLYDGDEESVVQCGDCLAVYEKAAAEELRASASTPSLVGAVVAKLRSTPPPPPARPASRPPPPPPRRVDEAEVDAELAALKRRLGK